MAPALVSEDTRPLAVVHAMERAMPGLRLAWAIGEGGELIAVSQDTTRGAARRRSGDFLLLCNGDPEHIITLSRSEVPGILCPGGKAQFFVFAEWPMDAGGLAAAADVLEGVAEAAGAYWAQVIPETLTLDLADQKSRVSKGPAKSPRGLPMLKQSREILSPDIPEHLGWLNYWSAAAARAIGFPDPARDAELLSRSRRTESDGWVVRFTEAPLDLDNPAHFQALLRAYERFPVIGGRAPA